MKIITIHINKGGTGKSTLSFNLAKWLSEEKGKKTLLIDGDHSQNLSFSFKGLNEESIYKIFNGDNKDFQFSRISENMDFIRGSSRLDDKSLDLQSKQNNCMIFFMWIADNYDRLQEYDYMIIDTHNDNSLVTANFLAVADIVLGVSEPSRNGYRAWHELVNSISDLKSKIIDPISRKSYISAQPYLIANKIDHIGNSSKQFLEAVEKEEKYLGMLQKKELLAKSLLTNQSIFELQNQMTEAEKTRHCNFYNNVNHLFNRIINL